MYGKPTHSPTRSAYEVQDRIFATQCGVEAAMGCLRGEYGYLIAQHGGKIVHVPLDEIADKLKYVGPECELVRQARLLGISFGDE